MKKLLIPLSFALLVGCSNASVEPTKNDKEETVETTETTEKVEYVENRQIDGIDIQFVQTLVDNGKEYGLILDNSKASEGSNYIYSDTYTQQHNVPAIIVYSEDNESVASIFAKDKDMVLYVADQLGIDKVDVYSQAYYEEGAADETGVSLKSLYEKDADPFGMDIIANSGETGIIETYHDNAEDYYVAFFEAIPQKVE